MEMPIGVKRGGRNSPEMAGIGSFLYVIPLSSLQIMDWFYVLHKILLGSGPKPIEVNGSLSMSFGSNNRYIIAEALYSLLERKSLTRGFTVVDQAVNTGKKKRQMQVLVQA